MALKTISLDGVEYVKADSIKAEEQDGLEYKIVRTKSAGVFAGYLKSETETGAILVNVRRLWKWAGAASISQLAMEGVKKPSECKFPCKVSEISLREVIEICSTTKKAKDSIDSVKVWEC